MTIVPEPAWQEVLDRLITTKGTAILIGSTDSGKSTLARYLVQEIVAAGRSVSLVDADIGQSSLGLPGTISRKTFRSTEELERFRYERLSFVGAVSPAGILSRMIEETRRMALLGRAEAEVTIVDTTGLVTGEIGVRLKLGKIRAVAPNVIIAIEMHDELAPILAAVDDIPASILEPSPMVTARSQEARSRYRQKKLADYFSAADERLVATRGVTLCHRGRPLPAAAARGCEGIVIGLNHHDDTVGLGIVREADEETVTFLTPLTSLRGINRLIFGDFTIT